MRTTKFDPVAWAEAQQAAKESKEKQKGKPWKNVSSSDKDWILFQLAKKFGFVDTDMLYE